MRFSGLEIYKSLNLYTGLYLVSVIGFIVVAFIYTSLIYYSIPTKMTLSAYPTLIELYKAGIISFGVGFLFGYIFCKWIISEENIKQKRELISTRAEKIRLFSLFPLETFIIPIIFSFLYFKFTKNVDWLDPSVFIYLIIFIVSGSSAGKLVRYFKIKQKMERSP